MADLKENTLSGMHSEKLSGRDHQTYFSDDYEDSNLLYHGAFEVDFNRKSDIDAEHLTASEVNTQIMELMKAGYGHIIVKNPGAKHSIGVGILNRLKLTFQGSLGYFGCGLVDGPNIVITGRVGWSCAENMMAGTILVEKNAGSTFGAAIRGGDLVCKGDVGSRTGIDQKGGTIIVGGRAGAFSGFMMQRGRMVILGDAGKNLGDSMYDGTIYVGGAIEDLGVDAFEGKMTSLDSQWLTQKLSLYGLEAPNGVETVSYTHLTLPTILLV